MGDLGDAVGPRRSRSDAATAPAGGESGAAAGAIGSGQPRLGRWDRLLQPACMAAFWIGLAVSFLGGELLLRLFALPKTGALRRRRFNVLTRYWGRWVSGMTTLLLRVRLEVRGNLPAGRHVVVSNHQSLADIIFFMATLSPHECKFVAKQELARGIPSISTALREGGAALIARDGSRAELAALTRFARGLEAWEGTAVIFAEGSRSADGDLGRLRTAAARVVARESGLPLLPACIEGTHAAKDLRRLARGLYRAHVVIVLGRPVAAPTRATGFQQVMTEIEDWQAGVLRDLRRTPASTRREEEVA